LNIFSSIENLKSRFSKNVFQPLLNSDVFCLNNIFYLGDGSIIVMDEKGGPKLKKIVWGKKMKHLFGDF
jgi:hypothetical protein